MSVLDLTVKEARDLTDRIRAGLVGLLPLIREAFQRRADRALGYGSWADYCDTELRGVRIPVQDRAETFDQLKAAGMSNRAIGSALGIGKSTVDRESSGVPSGTPDRTIGLDGKSYPASRPVPVEFSAAVRDALAEHAAEQARRQTDREALDALADELNLKPDPAAEVEENRRIALLYPFFDAIARLAGMPDPADLAGQIRAHEAYHLDNLPLAVAWLGRFESHWKENQ